MEFVVYIYAGKYARDELTPFYCCRCKRIVFKNNSSRMVITNAYGASLKTIKAGLKDGTGMPAATLHKCHSCKSVYQILYQ